MKADEQTIAMARDLRARGFAYAHIASLCRMSLSWAYDNCLDVTMPPGVMAPCGGPARRLDYDAARSLRMDGASLSEIASRYGITPQHASHICRGVAPLQPMRRGPKQMFNHSEARQMRSRGMTLAAIGRFFGVSRERIRQITTS